MKAHNLTHARVLVALLAASVAKELDAHGVELAGPYDIGAGYDHLLEGGMDVAGLNLNGLNLNGGMDVGADQLGAALRAAAAVSPQAGAALVAAMRAAQRPHLTGNTQPNKVLGDRVLPLFYSQVPANTTVNVVGTPQQAFKGRRLSYAGPTGTFLIQDIQIMQKSQLVQTIGMQAEQFPPTAINPNLAMDMVSANVPITLVVANITGSAADFRANIFGETAE